MAKPVLKKAACLFLNSAPSVPRAEKVKIRALERDGKPFELEADGLLAICIQHEMDHWSANCLLTICHHSNNSAFVRR